MKRPAGTASRLDRWLPATLFGRLALLLFVAVVASHVLALTLMFELRPAPPPGAAAPGQRPPFYPGLLLDIGTRLAALMLAAWVGARWLTQPIDRLARAARELGRDIHRPPLPEDGTLECREASRVFNQMQARIRQQIDERDQFVAAVSHDLRTPLTRLRLRAEALGDARQRHAFGRDIDQMDEMIRVTLDYLRGASAPEPMMLLDLDALVASLIDDQRACGHAVRGSGHAAPLLAQPGALRRCLDNLVENAVRFGGEAEIRVADAPGGVCVEVHDRGPGLPPDELTKVLAPFYRLEGSRNRHGGGTGLGLSIAHDIARRHHGDLSLRNGESGGLVATLTLPRQTHQPPG